MTITAAILGFLLVSGPAVAAVGTPLVQFGARGSGAGQLETNGGNTVGGGVGGGVVADPASGHIYISEVGNDRISEFTAWGEFVKAWGWGVSDGSPELQSCIDSCQAGSGGSGPGQMEQPNGLTLDEAGNVYVFERLNNRVQAFSPAGEFLRMIGGGVNQTTGESICTQIQVSEGDVCGAGAAGTGPGEFGIGGSTSSTAGDYVATSPDGRIVVGDTGRIEEFEPDGTFVGEVTFKSIHEADPTFPESGDPGALAIDPETGQAYFSFAHLHSPANAFRLSGSWVVEQQLPTVAADSLALAGNGSVFVGDERQTGSGGAAEETELLEVDSAGAITDSCCSTFWVPALATNVVSESGARDLYVLHAPTGGRALLAEIRGPAPDKWPPPTVPPTVEGQFASSVGERTAMVKGEINPNFWQDTAYRLEYGSGTCDTGGCPHGTEFTPLGSGIVNEGITTEGIELTGLSPGSTYHFRFVARSGGGGPTVGGEGTFTTFAAPAPDETGCANQAFRSGTPSAALPDCRAYEMVSPVEKAGGDILVQCNSLCLPARLDQAAPSGGAVTYSSYRAFDGAESSGYTSQYLARRDAGDWSTEAISPRREGASFLGSLGLDSQYRAFSEDLSSGWFLFDTEPLLASGAVTGYSNVYRRDDAGGYEAITTSAPPGGTETRSYRPEVQGFSADGTRTFFAAPAKLTADAAEGIDQIYEAHEGGLRMISERPNGAPATEEASIGSRWRGSGGEPGEGRGTNLTHAVSEDGSRVYWTEGAKGSGKLYVRVGSTRTFGVSTGDALFWAATPSGSEAIYTEGGELLRYALASKKSTPLATGVEGVMGESEDLARVYFVSSEALAGDAEAGAPNLYLYEEGQPLAFIAALSSDDVSVRGVSPIAPAPWRRASRVSPDGRTAVFMSRAPLTGADNVDAVSGEADAEVFRYQVGGGGLLCVSCNPTGARPQGAEYVRNKIPQGYWYAAQIPGFEFQFHAPRVLSADGVRAFFDSFEPLVPGDTNGRQDVYEWEAPGVGTCATTNARFSPTAGGCVSLVSDGGAEGDSEFVDAGADGADAFFTTGASLVARDPGEVDLYDARVDGGFAEPTPAAECEGEACQVAGPAPPNPAVTSESFVGPGDQVPAHRCRAGHVRRHGKCVRKAHPKKHKKRHHGCGKKHHGKKHHGKKHHGKKHHGKKHHANAMDKSRRHVDHGAGR